MAYGDWTIGGISPTNIESVDRDPATAGGSSSGNGPTLTFHCVAKEDLVGDDPRTEIDKFNAMACQVINNDQLLNGGTKLQVQGGDTITITEHTPLGDVDYTAAIEEIKYSEDDMSEDAIWYDIVAHYEKSGKSSSNIYVPPYFAYSNCKYSYGTDGTAPSFGGDWVGTEIGIFNITETRKVRKVVVKGSACTLPAWLSVNGEKQYWSVYHDINEDPSNAIKQGLQVLTFENFTPSTQINMLTSNHTAPWVKTVDHPDANQGCWPIWIEVIYE